MKIRSKMWSRLFVTFAALILGASAVQAATITGGPHNGTHWTGTKLQTIATIDANQGAALYMDNSDGYSQSFTAEDTMTVEVITLLTQRFGSGLDFKLDVYELIGQGSSSPDPANSDRFRYSNAGHSTLLKSYSLNSSADVSSGNRGDNYVDITLDAGEQFDVTAGHYYAVHIYTAGTGIGTDRLMIWDYSDQSSYASGRYGTSDGGSTVEARDFGLAISAGPITLAANADTYVLGEDPTVNYNDSNNRLLLRSRDVNGSLRSQYAYIRFDLTSYANLGAGAVFGLTSQSSTGWSSTQLRVYGLPDTAGLTAQDWAESTLTYDSTGTEFTTVALGVDPLDTSNLVDLGYMPAGAGNSSVSLSSVALDAFLASRAGSTATLIVANTFASDRAMNFASRETAIGPELLFNADPAPAPETPTGLAAVAGGYRQIDLIWDMTAGATGYNISIYNHTTTQTVIEAAAGPISYAVTGLDVETQYTFKIAATKSEGDSAFSSDVIASTDPAYLNEFDKPLGAVTPIIDGIKTLGEWGDAFELSMLWPDLGILPNVGSISYTGNDGSGNPTTEADATEADISAVFSFKWDATNLYILAEVTDDSFIKPFAGGGGYPDDHFILGIDPDVTDGDAAASIFLAEIFINSADVTSASFLSGQSIADPALNDFTNHILTGSAVAGGYVIELALNWADLGVTSPVSGDMIGVSMLLMDNDIDDGSRDIIMCSSGNGSNPIVTPSLYHQVTLAGAMNTFANYISQYEVGELTAESDDPDLDEVDNFTEYALGGDPSVSDAPSMQPVGELAIQGEDDVFAYTYNRRIGATALGLSYAVKGKTDLTGPTWSTTGITDEVETETLDDEFEAVTATTPMTEDNKFLRLEIN